MAESVGIGDWGIGGFVLSLILCAGNHYFSHCREIGFADAAKQECRLGGKVVRRGGVVTGLHHRVSSQVLVSRRDHRGF